MLSSRLVQSILKHGREFSIDRDLTTLRRREVRGISGPLRVNGVGKQAKEIHLRRKVSFGSCRRQLL
jgi:hypothetical protein